MNTPHRLALALLWIAPFVAPGVAAAKGKPAPAAAPKATPGLSKLDCKPFYPYISMAVPNDYAPEKFYPLFFHLPPVSDSAELTKPDQWVKAWSDVLLKRGWIIASPAAPMFDNETSLAPLSSALKKVLATYHIDERRIVVGGYGAGGMMAWRMAVKFPDLWVGVLTVAGEIDQMDRGNLKVLAGKPVYIFRGVKDPNYTADMLKSDKANIEFAKMKLTLEERKDWKNDFPADTAETMGKWFDTVYPGTYYEKSVTVEKAIADKTVTAGFAALAELKSELKKSPYVAFDSKAVAYEKALYELVRAPFEEAKKLLETNPIAALEQTEAAAKALKGNPALEKEAAAFVTAAKKDPRVIDALKTRDAESAARAILPKAEEAEAKGDFVKALALFKRIVALGNTTLKVDCEAKVAELEKKVPPDAVK